MEKTTEKSSKKDRVFDYFGLLLYLIVAAFGHKFLKLFVSEKLCDQYSLNSSTATMSLFSDKIKTF